MNISYLELIYERSVWFEAATCQNGLSHWCQTLTKQEWRKWDALMTRGHNAAGPQQKTWTIILWIIHLTSQAMKTLLLSSYLIKPWHFDWPFKLQSLSHKQAATPAETAAYWSVRECLSSCDTLLGFWPIKFIWIHLCAARSHWLRSDWTHYLVWPFSVPVRCSPSIMQVYRSLRSLYLSTPSALIFFFSRQTHMKSASTMSWLFNLHKHFFPLTF